MQFEKLLKMELKYADAWAMEGRMRHFWDCQHARKFFEECPPGCWLAA